MRRWKPRSLFRQGEFILYNKQSGGRVSCLYSQVVKVKETKRLCILMMPKNLAVLVDRRALPGRMGGFPRIYPAENREVKLLIPIIRSRAGKAWEFRPLNIYAEKDAVYR